VEAEKVLSYSRNDSSQKKEKEELFYYDVSINIEDSKMGKLSQKNDRR
jgi:hypothetical protein